MRVSIVIPTYNKINRLTLMLKVLYKQINYNNQIEVVVINDGSDELYEDRFRKLQEIYGFRYIKEENKGRAHARNKGIECTISDILLFVDDDIIVAPDFIEQHICNQNRELKILHGSIKNFIYSYAFLDPVSGTLYHQDDQLAENQEYFEYLKKKCQILNQVNDYNSLFKQSKYMKLEKRIIEVFEKNNSDMEWISFTGGNVSCPRKWLEEVNGFDEKFGLKWGCEDLEIGYRLKKSDRKFEYSYDASCCHIDHKKNDALVEHQINTDYFYNKHNDKDIVDLNKFLFHLN